MIKIVAISTSLRLESESRKMLLSIDNDLQVGDSFIHINLLDERYKNICCDGCEKCRKLDSCTKEINFSLLEVMKSADIIILALPIYYGCISGKSKSFLELMYPLKNNELKDKTIIAILASSKPNQEGIAVIELLPWCFKHGAILTQVESVHDLLTDEEKRDIAERINLTLKEDRKKDIQVQIDFKDLKYFNKQVGIPIKYNTK